MKTLSSLPFIAIQCLLMPVFAFASPFFVDIGPNAVLNGAIRMETGTFLLTGYYSDPLSLTESAILVTIDQGSPIAQIIFLGSPESTIRSRATGIRGNYISGFFSSNTQDYGVGWDIRDLSNPILIDPVLFPGVGDSTLLSDINSGGQFSGNSGSNLIAITGNLGQSTESLPSLGVGVPIASAISESGAIVGSYSDGDSLDAVIWKNGQATILNNSYSNQALALDISENDTLIGGTIGVFFDLTEQMEFQAAVWSGEGYSTTTLLWTEEGSPLLGKVSGVTDDGYAVGNSQLGGFIWHNSWTYAQVFNSWVLTEFGINIPSWVLSVNDVFSDGQSLTFALQGSAYLLSVPTSSSTVPEPATLMLFGAVLPLAFRRQRQRRQVFGNSKITP